MTNLNAVWCAYERVVRPVTLVKGKLQAADAKGIGRIPRTAEHGNTYYRSLQVRRKYVRLQTKSSPLISGCNYITNSMQVPSLSPAQRETKRERITRPAEDTNNRRKEASRASH
jgi:hypothetical protein